MKAVACVIRSEKVRRLIQTNYVTHLEAAAQLYVAKICDYFAIFSSIIIIIIITTIILIIPRSKNTVNILIKNMLDAFIGAASYWAIGWGLAYGPEGNYFCGGSE